MKLNRCAVLVLAFAVLVAPVLASEGKRKGFILGGGVGGGYLWVNGEPGFDQNRFSPVTNFKIGYAQSESVEVYYLNSCSIEEAGVNIANCLGITKYLNREGKGLFLYGGAGLAVLYALWDSQTGFSVLGGVGYDIGKHWSIQGDVLYTNRESGIASVVSFRMSINFLAF